MTTQAAPTLPASPWTEDFDRFLAEEGAELPGLGPVRRDAMRRFAELGFPTPRDEDWHFTSVSAIAETEWRSLRAPLGEVKPADLAPFTFGADWPTLVFVNGRYAPELSSAAGLPAGVRAMDLARAAREMPDLVERHLTKVATVAGWKDNAFTALNTAFAVDGAVVHVAKEAVADRPVHLLFVSDSEAAKGVTHPRVLIVADRHSKATVIESHVALTEAGYFTNAVSEVVVGEGATLTHYKLQRESARAFHVATSEAHQGRDSHYINFSFASGALLSRANIYTILDGEGCGSTLNGLYVVDGDQHVDHQTRIEHAQPNCFSREHYKGIMDGSSHGVFNGKVYVHPEAQKTDGKQTNNNLLLSERARADAKPQLEIFADDVKCTHGATVGRIDETALFYMKSRGVGATLARQLLTYAFAAEVLETIETAEVREGLERLTLRRFTGLEERSEDR